MQGYFCKCLETICNSCMDDYSGLKDGLLASSGGSGMHSFVCLWIENRTGFSFSLIVATLLGPQLESFSPVQVIRKSSIEAKERIKANKAKIRKGEFSMKCKCKKGVIIALRVHAQVSQGICLLDFW